VKHAAVDVGRVADLVTALAIHALDLSKAVVVLGPLQHAHRIASPVHSGGEVKEEGGGDDDDGAITNGEFGNPAIRQRTSGA